MPTSRSRSGHPTDSPSCSARSATAAACLSFPRAAVPNAIVSSFGYEPIWSPDGTLILFKRSAVLPDLPTIYVVGLDGKPPRSVRPDLLAQFRALHAAWHPDGRRISVWGTTGEGDVRFLTVPLDAGSVTAPEIAARVRQDLAGVSAGRFAWTPSRRYHLFRGAGGRYPERLAHYCRSGHGEMGRWPRTADDRRRRRDERRRFAGRNESCLHGDVEPNEALGLPIRFDAGAISPVNRIRSATAARERWISTRKPTARRSPIAPSGQAAASCGSDRSPKDGSDCVLSSTDWRMIKPRWSPDGAKLAFSRCTTRGSSLAIGIINTDGSGERMLTKPGQVDMQGFDWSRDGQTILGACRFSPSERYSTCLIPVSSASEAGDAAVRVIASDPKRNLFNQRFSPDQRWITFLAHDLSYASTSTVYVTAGERRCLAGHYRWHVVRRQAALGARRTGPVLRVESHRRRERMGTTNRRRDRHAGWGALPRHIVPLREVPAVASDRADGHRRHSDASTSADKRIAERNLDAGPGRSLKSAILIAHAYHGFGDTFV